MRVDKVNQGKKVGFIKFNNDEEIDLIDESINLLIKKQEKEVEMSGGGGRGGGSRRNDIQEVQKLERMKKTKQTVIDMAKMERQQMKEMRKNIKDNILKKKENKDKDIEDIDEFKATQRMKLEGGSEANSLTGNIEVNHKNMYVIVNALNQHIVHLEKEEGTSERAAFKSDKNKNKYERLKKMLREAQKQKSQFQRVPPKPKGFGRLRK